MLSNISKIYYTENKINCFLNRFSLNPSGIIDNDSNKLYNISTETTAVITQAFSILKNLNREKGVVASDSILKIKKKMMLCAKEVKHKSQATDVKINDLKILDKLIEEMDALDSPPPANLSVR